MFSLIITVISIALVAALALATLYYGGTAFNKGAARAEASKILLQGSQLVGAADLYFTDHRAWPPTLDALVTGGYLKQIPVVQVAVGDAHAASLPWTMPIDNTPMFVLPTAGGDDVCAEVNLAGSLRQRGVLTKAYTELVAQCYGSSETSLQTVFKKALDTRMNDGAGAGLPEEDIVNGPPPTNLEDPAWRVPPSENSTPSGPPAAIVEPDTNVLSFGSLPLGTSEVATVTWNNTGNADASLVGPTLTGDSSFSISVNTCGTALARTSSCYVTVSYLPTTPGAKQASLTMSVDGVPVTVDVTSSALWPVIELSSEQLDFDTRMPGSTTQLQASATNTGNAPFTFDSQPAVSGSSAYQLTSGACTATLNPGAACSMTVAFTPPSAGAHGGSVSFTGFGNTYSIALTGAGASPPVTLGAGSFAATRVGNTSATTMTVTNISALPVNIGSPGSDQAGISVGAGTCTGTLAAGASCSLSASFAPTTGGSVTANVQLPVSNTYGGFVVNSTATGYAQVATWVPATQMAYNGYRTPGFFASRAAACSGMDVVPHSSGNPTWFGCYSANAQQVTQGGYDIYECPVTSGGYNGYTITQSTDPNRMCQVWQ